MMVDTQEASSCRCGEPRESSSTAVAHCVTYCPAQACRLRAGGKQRQHFKRAPVSLTICVPAACCALCAVCCVLCRNDAGLAGAELALAVEEHTLATGAEDTVGTTGTFEVSPNAVNSVPREARLAIGESDSAG